ncbi:putative mitogen-activated protein kinase kinase TTK family [Helianthus annuus]|uniref:Mitogen-activated protein kinase kinase TTK family n=1 Tax=Helianthus annuus TaxID=4232 RepID=A0A251UQU6_HELAN|nr:serine/threonine-protein kinase MPS1 isoform X2 [Helianthus annuus]KAF5806503.1 putative mitogen-activated protein kinase kinase TTK family [Helianthus annuus]KAJ0577709.1 putative mitogen-activated protein kinase kinase TTK family [Helianthus annuus]KAJ0919576.1 putative mitogen-activated protein kinase kinase TTK family [Helianthus annuus]
MDSREANLPSDHNIYPSFNAATSSSSSSFNSSPPDFLRNVQAAFKRHRKMPELNNLQPRRLVAKRVIKDSKTDESQDVLVKQRVQDSGTLMKSMSTLTTVNCESASVTPPSGSDTPTEDGQFMSIDVQRGQPSFNCDCRTNNMVDLPCVKCRDGPKKVQFALGNDTRSHETERDVNNRQEVLTAPNHDLNDQNLKNQVNPLSNFLQSDFRNQVTSSSVVGSTCATTTLVNSVNAPMLSSTTCNSQLPQIDTVGPPKHNNIIIADQNPVKDPPVLVDKSTKGDPPGGHSNMDLQSQPLITNDQISQVTSVTSNSERSVKPASKKDALAPRKRSYDHDQFFKVNGKLYQRLGKIGSGGSSEVHKVISQDCTIYALKKIKLKGRDYGTAFGFCQEIEYLNKLRGKDHIIQLIDYEVTDKALLKEVMSGSMTNKDGKVKEDGCIYMVLEYGEIDLAHMLSQKWRELDDSKSTTLDENWLRFYWQQILLAVKTIHEERIVHSDLKPANFLLVRGSLKLIDFGIAKAIMSDTTNIQRDSQMGTLSYMSPEAFLCNETDANGNIIKCGRPSDIWSLGCILYQMVYGRTPFADYTTFWAKFKVITDPDHEIRYESLPNSWLIDLMKKCLVWDRKERWTIPQLLQHPFLVPKIPHDLFQLVADSCSEDSDVTMLCSRFELLVNNSMPDIKSVGPGSISPDKKCSLVDEMLKLCYELKKKLM